MPLLCMLPLQVKGVADAGAASMRVSGLELGGLCGSLVAGWLSDKLINNKSGAASTGGNVGKRIRAGGGGGVVWVGGGVRAT